ncbi:hypothetical protein ACFSMW_09455 [Virgibacillus halophilus]|uniref:Uncharacterized protein n=1 Tax=Tigheibacillus halophilus TaxID=361280 RepID=A0ABU5C4I4_9BACI|nr:hypothetical protein [Virgibacillus halophilus]
MHTFVPVLAGRLVHAVRGYDNTMSCLIAIVVCGYACSSVWQALLQLNRRMIHRNRKKRFAPVAHERDDPPK